MSSRRTLYFWQNALSPHQAPLIRTLAMREGITVHLVAEEELSAGRAEMGWRRPDYGEAAVTVSRSLLTWLRIWRSSGPDDLHFFSGAGVYPLVSWMTRLSSLSSRRSLVLSEAWDPRDDTGLRRVVRRARLYSVVPNRVERFLVTGRLAERQLIDAHVPSGRISQWAYFPETGPANSMPRNVDVLYVGSLSPRKDVKTLLAALSLLPNVKLAVIGDGPSREILTSQACASPGLADRCHFLGPVENSAVPDYLGRARVLALPSLHDGWGAVVSEALLSGCRVAVSQEAGSSILAEGNLPVRTFPAKDPAACAEAIQSLLSDSSWDEASIARVATQTISPAAGAEYLMALIDSPTTPCPWLPRPAA